MHLLTIFPISALYSPERHCKLRALVYRRDKVPLMTSRKDRTHIRPQPEDVRGDGLEELKEARFSPLFYAGKHLKNLCEFSNDKGTLLLKNKKNSYHHTLPLTLNIIIAQLHINVYVTTLAYKMCMLQILHTWIYMPYKMCMFQLLPGCNVACMQRYTVDIYT